MPQYIGEFGRLLIRQLTRIIETGTQEELKAFWPYIETYKHQFDSGIDVFESTDVVLNDDVTKVLSNREARLYSLLRTKLGEIVKAEDITRSIWGSQNVDASTLPKLVEKLKRKVEPYGYKIYNSHSNGYYMEMKD